jgi:hypothetical protein
LTTPLCESVTVVGALQLVCVQRLLCRRSLPFDFEIYAKIFRDEKRREQALAGPCQPHGISGMR